MAVGSESTLSGLGSLLVLSWLEPVFYLFSVLPLAKNFDGFYPGRNHQLMVKYSFKYRCFVP